MSLKKDLKDIQLSLEIAQHQAKQNYRDSRTDEMGNIILGLGKLLNQISGYKVVLMRDKHNG